MDRAGEEWVLLVFVVSGPVDILTSVGLYGYTEVA